MAERSAGVSGVDFGTKLAELDTLHRVGRINDDELAAARARILSCE